MAIRYSSVAGSSIPFGDNAERPASPETGQPFFNGQAARLELYTSSSGWQNIVQETPSVVNISGTYVEAVGSGTITINGTNFAVGAIAYAIGIDGSQIQADVSTTNSAVDISATFSNLDSNFEPYDIKVVNPSNLYGILYDALQIDDTPVWNTQSGSLGTFIEESPLSINLSVTDPGNSAIIFSVSSGSMPPGLSINQNTGVISGTPQNVVPNTTYSFSIDAFDGENHSSRSFTITISDRGPIWITGQTLPAFTKNVAYSTSIVATDDDGIDSYSISSGSLPAGLSLSSAGVISGTVTSISTQSIVTIRATDIGGNYSDRQFTIPNAGPVWTTPSGALPIKYAASNPYSYQLQAVDDSGIAPTYSLLSGALPSGISMSSSGLISGTTTATGDYAFTVSSIDNNGVITDRSFTILESPTLPPQMDITSPGTYTWTVTKGGTFDVQAWGAEGQTGSYASGRGGYVSGRLTTIPGTYYILVGGQGSGTTGGFNGGGAGGSGYEGSGLGAGGATDIRVSSNTESSRIIVAAGGGSANTGGYGSAPPQGDGGSGDYYAGSNFVGYGGQGGSGCANGTNGGQYGGANGGYGSGGGGGGLLSGGAGGGTDGPGSSGGFGPGGSGGSQRRGTGGGGGGWYGGGGGGSGSGGCCGGGGGGSSYIDTTKFSNAAFTGGAKTGHGRIAFTLV